jgi:hypothetical protein
VFKLFACGFRIQWAASLDSPDVKELLALGLIA